MKNRKILILGIVAALFVVGVLWYVSGERVGAPMGTVPVISVDTVQVSQQATFKPEGTTSKSEVGKKVRKKKIVPRYDEHVSR